MSSQRDDSCRRLALIAGVAALAIVVLLLVQDAAPGLFPAGSHRILAASSLASIACACVASQAARRAGAMELVKASLLAAAFLFWAANQLWPGLPQASLLNDAAIGLFVLDAFLAMAGWPRATGASFFSASGGRCAGRCHAGCGCADSNG